MMFGSNIEQFSTLELGIKEVMKIAFFDQGVEVRKLCFYV